jgi:hypothetical protein
MKTRIVWLAVTMLCCASVVFHAQPPQTSADRVAAAMVAALKANPGALGQAPALEVAASLQGDEKAAYQGTPRKVRDVAAATTGESHTGMQAMQVVMDIDGWFLSRRPLGTESVARYLARFAKVEKATIDKWRAAQGKSGVVGNSPTLTLNAIVFQDFLWEGADWKPGNPDRAITRLGSLSEDAVSRWNEIAKDNGSTLYGAWTLLAVDGLFVNDSFQQAVFDAAFPAAKKLLNPR